MWRLRYFLIVLVLIVSLISWLVWAKVPEWGWAFLAESSALENFHVLAELLFGVNLLFTALIAFGRLSGSRVQQWVDHEKLRILPALAENNDFNEVAFKNCLEEIERAVLEILSRINNYVLGGVLLAGAAIVIFSFTAAFRPKLTVENSIAFLFFAIVCSPVPIGFLLHCLVRSFARLKMWINARDANALLKFVRPTAARNVAHATAALKKKIRQERRHGE